MSSIQNDVYAEEREGDQFMALCYSDDVEDQTTTQANNSNTNTLPPLSTAARKNTIDGGAETKRLAQKLAHQLVVSTNNTSSSTSYNRSSPFRKTSNSNSNFSPSSLFPQTPQRNSRDDQYSPNNSQVSVGSVPSHLTAGLLRQYDLTPIMRNTSASFQHHSAPAPSSASDSNNLNNQSNFLSAPPPPPSPPKTRSFLRRDTDPQRQDFEQDTSPFRDYDDEPMVRIAPNHNDPPEGLLLPPAPPSRPPASQSLFMTTLQPSIKLTSKPNSADEYDTMSAMPSIPLRKFPTFESREQYELNQYSNIVQFPGLIPYQPPSSRRMPLLDTHHCSNTRHQVEEFLDGDDDDDSLRMRPDPLELQQIFNTRGSAGESHANHRLLQYPAGAPTTAEGGITQSLRNNNILIEPIPTIRMADPLQTTSTCGSLSLTDCSYTDCGDDDSLWTNSNNQNHNNGSNNNHNDEDDDTHSLCTTTTADGNHPMQQLQEQHPPLIVSMEVEDGRCISITNTTNNNENDRQGFTPSTDGTREADRDLRRRLRRKQKRAQRVYEWLNSVSNTSEDYIQEAASSKFLNAGVLKQRTSPATVVASLCVPHKLVHSTSLGLRPVANNTMMFTATRSMGNELGHMDQLDIDDDDDDEDDLVCNDDDDDDNSVDENEVVIVHNNSSVDNIQTTETKECCFVE